MRGELSLLPGNTYRSHQGKPDLIASNFLEGVVEKEMGTVLVWALLRRGLPHPHPSSILLSSTNSVIYGCQ